MASTDEVQPQEVQNRTGDNNNKPKLKFRNYNPQDEELKEKKLPKAKPESANTMGDAHALDNSCMTSFCFI
eukprot:Em0007g679a